MKRVIALILAFICIELLFIIYDKPEITGDSLNIPFDRNSVLSSVGHFKCECVTIM
jgi:hypothetical protein